MAKPLVIYERTKDPESELDYGFVWSDWLLESPGDAIVTTGDDVPVWTVTPTGDEDDIVKGEQAQTTEITGLMLSGGRNGVDYYVTCQVTLTPSGRKDERTMRIRVRDR